MQELGVYNELVLDLETTYSMRKVSKNDKKTRGRVDAYVTDFGSPFNHGNKIVRVGVYSPSIGYKLFNLDSHPEGLEELKEIITSHDAIVGHNIKYDVHWLRAVGIDTTSHRLFDTLTTEYCLRGGSRKYGQLGLDTLALEYGGTNKIDITKKLWDSGVNTDEIPQYILDKYQYLDVHNTWLIREGQKKKLATTHKWAQRICNMDSLLVSVTEEMEYNGIKVDKDFMEELRIDFEQKVRDAERHLYKVMQPETDKIVDRMALDLAVQLESPPEKDTTHYKKKLQRLKDDVAKYGSPRGYVENTFTFDVGSAKQLSEMLYSIRLRPERRKEWHEFIDNLNPYAKGVQTELDRKVILCFEKLHYGYNIKPTPLFVGKNGASSGKKAIEHLHQSGKLNKRAQEFVDAFVDLSKKNTWLDGNYYQLANNVSDDGFIHGSFIQAGTGTGRYSSSNPNMQNQPSKDKTAGENRIRKMLVSRFGKDGFIVAPDYSQLEYRGAFQIAQAKKGISDFKNGMDLHTDRAKWTIDGMKGEGTWDNATDEERKHWRSNQKTVNFGLLYGSNAKNDLQKAMFDSFYADYPEVKDWNERVVADIKALNYYECPMTGARYYLHGATSDNFYRGYDSKGRGWKNKALNFPVQGGSGRIMQVSGISILREIRERNLTDWIKVCGQVHDEWIFDVHKDYVEVAVDIINRHMKGVDIEFKNLFDYQIEVPMNVDVELGYDYFDVYDVSEYKEKLMLDKHI